MSSVDLPTDEAAIDAEELTAWRGKKLITTNEFRNELYSKYKKNLDLVHEILNEGKHAAESRQKQIVRKPTKGGYWELVYAEKSGCVILIHLKLRRYRGG